MKKYGEELKEYGEELRSTEGNMLRQNVKNMMIKNCCGNSLHRGQAAIMLNNLQGYSLMELLIVISLLATVLFFAVPQWHSMTQRSATIAQSYKVVAALEYARTLAIKNNQKVALCRRFTVPLQRDWSGGQVVRNMRDGKILRIFDAVPSQSKLLWSSSFNKNDCIVFTPAGIPDGQQGSFYYCNYRNGEVSQSGAGKIVVQETGNIYAQLLEGQQAQEGCY